MRLHDPSKAILFKKYACAGNNTKVLKMNSTKDKLYYICASDRSRIIEYDLKSIELKNREIKFKFGKIIDLEIVDDLELVTLNKDGVVQIRDLRKKDWVPPKKSKEKRAGKDVDPDEDIEEEDDEQPQKAEDGSLIKKDVLIELQSSNPSFTQLMKVTQKRSKSFAALRRTIKESWSL